MRLGVFLVNRWVFRVDGLSMDKLIRSMYVPIIRNLEREKNWDHEKYSNQVDEALNHHCKKATVSEYFRNQLSKMIHQGYLCFGDYLFTSPVRSLYETMGAVVEGDEGRGKLTRITKAVGFEVLHIHFAQSSCIIENWVNHARQTALVNQPFTHEVIYENLISSLSKIDKTGEWIVYSKTGGDIKFWCVWLHKAGDDQLIKIIKEQCA